MDTDKHRFSSRFARARSRWAGCGGLVLNRCLTVFIWGFFIGAVSGAEPVRVVSQTVGTDELLLAVADPGQIVALSHIAREPSFSAVAEEAKMYPAIEIGDAETILKYRPTLVLGADYSRGELLAQVERAGVEVMRFSRYETLEDSFANLRTLAARLGPTAEVRAEGVIADVKRRELDLRERMAGVTPVRVIAPSTYGVIGGADTTFQDLCDYAGAENLAKTWGGLVGHVPPPREQMLTWPVERVVVAGGDAESALEPYRRIPPYRFMAAVKEGRVALIESYMLSCVSHHRMNGYERLARQLHPERFLRVEEASP
jgi:iron complex transport system substrate-binding protein